VVGIDRDTEGNVVVHAPAATATFAASSPKISVTMPLAWIVRGYVLAGKRMEDRLVDSASGNAVDVSIALFELGNWFVSLVERRPDLAGNADVRALTFLRNRKHHHWAAAVYYDKAGTGEWRWFTADVLPEPRRSDYSPDPDGQRRYLTHLDRGGESMYRQQLAQRPVREVFHRLEPVIIALAPDADLH
jgi:hypothetical protein